MADVRVDRQGAVWVVTIDRASKMNSLDFAAHEALVDVWRAFDADETARVGVITGAGDKAFCAGADLKTYTMSFATLPPHEFRRKWVDGIGLGLEIALACDLRFCSENAEFALQDSKWGFHACDGGLVRLPMIVGLGNAMEMILSGERIDAAQAHRIGLVNRVWPQAELLTKTIDYAQMLARRAPLAHRFAKATMRRMVGMPLADALEAEVRSFYDLGQSEDLAEGTQSFRERREANFKSR